MAEPDPLADSLAALARFFVGDSTLGETLHRVVAHAESAVGATDMTGITMLVEGKPTTAVFTDPEAPEIDVAQYDTGHGPCLDAFHSRQTMRIRWIETDDRWPQFAETAARHGVRSTLSLPLVVGSEAVGALNFYSRTPDAFDDAQEAIAESFAAQAAIVLANAQAYWDARSLSEHLTEALASRATIEQAKGIIMSQSHIPADSAFELLARASQRENRKLRDIAEELVRRTVEIGEHETR